MSWASRGVREATARWHGSPRRHFASAAAAVLGTVMLASCINGSSETAPPPATSSAPVTSRTPTSGAPTESTPAASTPTESTPTYTEARLITYPGTGALVRGPNTADRLHGAPDAFKSFIVASAETVMQPGSCLPTAGITVRVLRTDGYAIGGQNDCRGSGAATLWAAVDGVWRTIQVTQDAWDCRILEKYEVPSSVVGDVCYAYPPGDQKEHHYSQP